MRIKITNSITDKPVCTKLVPSGDTAVKEAFHKVIDEREGSNCKINWVDDQTVELENVSPMTLHNFTLHAEALGKQVKYRKQTIIEIN